MNLLFINVFSLQDLLKYVLLNQYSFKESSTHLDSSGTHSQPFITVFWQLLDAISHLASLGFEKSYRETVVLMTRSYLNKLSILGSADSKTLAAEATTERVEACKMF